MKRSFSDPRRALTLLASASAVLYALLFTLLPLLRSSKLQAQRASLLGVGARVARGVWGDALNDDPTLELWRRLLVIVVFVSLLVVYVLQVRAARRLTPPHAFSRRQVLAFAALFSLPLLLTDFPFYTDVHSYISYARIPLVYGGNPYLDVPASFPDVFVANIDKPWRYNASLYGPVWVDLSIAAAAAAEAVGGAAGAYLLSFKLMATLLHVGCVAVIYTLAARLRPGAGAPAAIAYGWNPLVLAEGPWNAHNDNALLLGLLLGFAYLSRARPVRGLVTLTLSVLVKWVTLVAVPLYALVWMRQAPSLRARLLRWALAVGVFFAVCGAAFAPYWSGPRTLYEPIQWTWGHSFTNNSLGDTLLFEVRDARFQRGEGPDPRLAIQNAYAPLFAEMERTGRVDLSLISSDPGSSLERAVRLFVAGVLALTWLLWAVRVRDVESLVEGVGWCLFVYFTVASLFFWPWYLVTVVGVAALLPDRRLFVAALIVSISAWAIYMGDSGWLGDSGRRARALLAFGPPLLYLAFGRVRGLLVRA